MIVNGTAVNDSEKLAMQPLIYFFLTQHFYVLFFLGLVFLNLRPVFTALFKSVYKQREGGLLPEFSTGVDKSVYKLAFES